MRVATRHLPCGRPLAAKCASAVLISISALLFARAGCADEFESLKGLRGFYAYSLQSIGLSKTTELRANPDALKKAEDDSRLEMQRVMEVELRKAGIRVFTLEEFKNSPYIPSLELSEITILDDYGTMHTAINLGVIQLVTVHVNQRSAMATTWQRNRLVILGRDTAQRTRGTVAAVNEMLEELINDFLKANPRIPAISDHKVEP